MGSAIAWRQLCWPAGANSEPHLAQEGVAHRDTGCQRVGAQGGVATIRQGAAQEGGAQDGAHNLFRRIGKPPQ